MPGKHPDSYRQHENQTECLERYLQCINCGVEVLQERDFPATCEVIVVSGNLPPGTSPADIDRHYGGGIPSHEHEWVLVQGLSPILEDMAAILRERCWFEEIVDSYTDHQRDEVYYETGAECEAERTYRFELVYVAGLTDGERVDRDELEQDEKALEAVIKAEQAFPDETEIIDIDPDQQQGQVVVRHDGVEIGYGPGGEA